MKAAFIRQTGPSSVIDYGELPTPEPKAGEVLVRLAAAAVNPVDAFIRGGQVAMTLPFPFVIGRDLAGVVERIGAAVTRFKPGDRVWCNNQGIDGRQGTFAEFSAVREDLLYAMPDTMVFADMVALVHSGLTVCLGLDRIGGLKPGLEADVSVLNDVRGRFKLQDNERTEVIAERLLEPAFCLRAGRRFDATAPILPRAVAA